MTARRWAAGGEAAAAEKDGGELLLWQRWAVHVHSRVKGSVHWHRRGVPAEAGACGRPGRLLRRAPGTQLDTSAISILPVGAECASMRIMLSTLMRGPGSSAMRRRRCVNGWCAIRYARSSMSRSAKDSP